ncbi:unnamed protein product [Mytilus coruscus]|uniref:Uncharacterized protein n=1 Tax=Mytilus coruscus TaxID=42192 RepID=A0A6J8DAE1_MYTCO|nr:unnamed protein product [Mytilus coruscus]
MTCNICALYDKHGTFVTGCQNYKRDSINQHEKSESHKVNVNQFNGQKNPEYSEGAKALRALNQLTVNRLMLKFRNVFALCKKGRPYTDYPMLCDLDESKGLDIGTQYRTDKKAAEFASFIAKAEVAKIAQDMKDVRFISAISDGSTDSSYQEAEIVFVRHCHKGDIKINFSLVKNIPKADADSISKVIMSGMKKFDDDYAKKIVACGTDGASVMLGSKTGAVQRIREAVGRPWLIAVHCSGHKLKLAFKDTIKKKINLYDKISLFLLNIYYFYRNSCLNRAALKDSFKILNQTVILPTRTGGTRWMEHLMKAIECFLKGYDAITQHLNQLQNPDDKIYTSDKGNKAKFFLKVVNSKSVCNGPYLRKAMETVHDHLKGDLTSFESARRIFTTNILSALNVRFVENPGILKTCGVLDLLKFPLNTDEAKDYGDHEIAELVDYFRSGLIEAGVEVGMIEMEWTKLKHNLITRFKDPGSTTWKELNQMCSGECSNLLSLVDLILTIPASSADAERGFNRLKMAKSDWRSKLTDANLSDQLTIMLEGPSILLFDPVPAINLWSMTPRRGQTRNDSNHIIKPVNNPVKNPANDDNSAIETTEDEIEIEIMNRARRVVKLIQMIDNEPYESDNDLYLDESDDDELQYKDIDDRRSDQCNAFSDFCEQLETSSI